MKEDSSDESGPEPLPVRRVRVRARRRNKVTIRDIAEESGVSLTTVSLVLNHNPRISEPTRRKVLEVVKRRGYHPDSSARGLAAQQTRVLSVVVPPLSHVFADIYFGEIISGIYDLAQERDYKIMLDVANQTFVDKKEYMTLLNTRRADGMLFVASTVGDTYLFDFLESDFPFLLVNNYFEDAPLNFVMADYRSTAELAAEHLVGQGHRHIGMIRGELVQSGDLLHAAFVEALSTRGIPISEFHIVAGKFSEQSGYEAARVLLHRHPELTAILAGNDRMAIGAIQAALELGRQVPRDLSVMGVDDIQSARFTNPPLTTIRHDIYELGRRAADRLLALVHGDIESCRETLPVSLIQRQSTAVPSRA